VSRGGAYEGVKKVPPEYFFEKYPLLQNDGPFLVLLDFDGTLVPIRDNPRDCFLSREVRCELEAIAASPVARLAILSGRALPDLRKRVGIRNIYYGGNHGLEIAGPDMRYIHPEAVSTRSLIDKVRRSLETEIEDIKGVLLEKKKLTFTLHYRMVDKENRMFLRKAFYRTIAENSASERTKVLRGKKVLELAPNVPWDKGKAALFIMQELKGKYLPVYVGDDLTDETAFTALSESGITIKIGVSQKTAAKWCLKGQWEMTRFLQYLGQVSRTAELRLS
jgi:trehalose 6-phosphate phosphatase